MHGGLRGDPQSADDGRLFRDSPTSHFRELSRRTWSSLGLSSRQEGGKVLGSPGAFQDGEAGSPPQSASVSAVLTSRRDQEPAVEIKPAAGFSW